MPWGAMGRRPASLCYRPLEALEWGAPKQRAQGSSMAHHA